MKIKYDGTHRSAEKNFEINRSRYRVCRTCSGKTREVYKLHLHRVHNSSSIGFYTIRSKSHVYCANLKLQKLEQKNSLFLYLCVMIFCFLFLIHIYFSYFFTVNIENKKREKIISFKFTHSIDTYLRHILQMIYLSFNIYLMELNFLLLLTVNN